MSAGFHFDDNRKTFTAQFSVAGPRGPQGPKGDPGYTPQRGVDYWTPADIELIKAYIDEAVAKAIGGGSNSQTAILGKALLGTMILGKGV